ncbi:hypothetical protein [Mailhella sp.]
MSVTNIQSVPLGELLESYSVKCGDSKADVSGVDINKQFISTRALMSDIDTSKYAVVYPGCFACNLMHIGRDELIPIAYNGTEKDFIVSPAYSTFRLKEGEPRVLAEYLYMFFCSSEIDRLTWFYTDSSIRGNLKESRLFDIIIPLPPIEEQRNLVAAWKALRDMKEQNEALAEPLFALCRSRLQEMKKEYEAVEIGPFLTVIDNRNEKNDEFPVLGINKDKAFMPTAATTDGLDLKKYKVVRDGEFVFSGMQT